MPSRNEIRAWRRRNGSGLSEVREASVGPICQDRLPMRRDPDGSPRPARNWFLLLGFVLCLEFWVVVTSSVAHTF